MGKSSIEGESSNEDKSCTKGQEEHNRARIARKNNSSRKGPVKLSQVRSDQVMSGQIGSRKVTSDLRISRLNSFTSIARRRAKVVDAQSPSIEKIEQRSPSASNPCPKSGQVTYCHIHSYCDHLGRLIGSLLICWSCLVRRILSIFGPWPQMWARLVSGGQFVAFWDPGHRYKPERLL
jgi:hypothetical protein